MFENRFSRLELGRYLLACPITRHNSLSNNSSVMSDRFMYTIGLYFYVRTCFYVCSSTSSILQLFCVRGSSVVVDWFTGAVEAHFLLKSCVFSTTLYYCWTLNTSFLLDWNFSNSNMLHFDIATEQRLRRPKCPLKFKRIRLFPFRNSNWIRPYAWTCTRAPIRKSSVSN